MNRANGTSYIEARTVRVTASDSDENCARELFFLLSGEPGGTVFADERDAFIYRVHAMRDGEIDLAGEFVAFLEH